MMLKFAAMESGGNMNAISGTGAIGIFQLTGGTANSIGVRDRFNVDQNINGGMILTKDNIKRYLQNTPVTVENIYILHQLGGFNGSQVIKGAADGLSISQLPSKTQEAINNNYGSSAKTAAEYIELNSKALEAKYLKVVK
jgi:hypothetical protein